MSQDISLDLPDHNWHNWDEIMTHGDALRIFYRKHLCFMGKNLVYCRCSLKPIDWYKILAAKTQSHFTICLAAASSSSCVETSDLMWWTRFQNRCPLLKQPSLPCYVMFREKSHVLENRQIRETLFFWGGGRHDLILQTGSRTGRNGHGNGIKWAWRSDKNISTSTWGFP